MRNTPTVTKAVNPATPRTSAALPPRPPVKPPAAVAAEQPDDWRAFFRQRIEAAPFTAYDLDFDRDNPEMQAHASRAAYIDYYGRSGGEFWARMSMALQPKVIVEIGTAFGIRTNLIGKLNPGATLISFDILSPYPLNDLRVETGYLARLNQVPFKFIGDVAWDVKLPQPFSLCFIDGSHETSDVTADSEWAWENRDPARFAIVWDDYPLAGVRAAVDAFCAARGLELRTGGGMVWVGSEDWLKGNG